jgi:hypothetical protein
MGELYIRQVVLEIIPKTGLGKRIENLRITFSIEKNNESTPNKSEISVYNLAPDTRSIISAKNTRARLYVGYYGLTKNALINAGINLNSNVALIFAGNIHKVTEEIKVPDLITKIELADGENVYRNSRLEKGYPPNINLRSIFADLNKAMGIGKGSQDEIPNVKYANGVTLSGLTRDHLDTLCKANGLEWSIQDEQLQIITKGNGTSDSIVVLDSNTGLIASPNKTDTGVEFTSLMQPSIRPGRRVQVDSRILKGTFIVRNVTHSGDSQEGEFITKCDTTIKKTKKKKDSE